MSIARLRRDADRVSRGSVESVCKIRSYGRTKLDVRTLSKAKSLSYHDFSGLVPLP